MGVNIVYVDIVLIYHNVAVVGYLLCPWPFCIHQHQCRNCHKSENRPEVAGVFREPRLSPAPFLKHHVYNKFEYCHMVRKTAGNHFSQLNRACVGLLYTETRLYVCLKGEWFRYQKLNLNILSYLLLSN